MNTKKDAIDKIQNHIISEQEKYLATKTPRERLKPLFTDPEYHQADYAEELMLFFRYQETEQKKMIFDYLMKNKEDRKNEITNFLKRHNININVKENDFTEFDIFYRKNVDFNEKFELEENYVSQFWLSIFLDLGLLIGDDLIEKYPGTVWYFQDKHPRKMMYNKLGLLRKEGKYEYFCEIYISMTSYSRRPVDKPHPNAPIVDLDYMINSYSRWLYKKAG